MGKERSASHSCAPTWGQEILHLQVDLVGRRVLFLVTHAKA